jgi:hypothetical protein
MMCWAGGGQGWTYKLCEQDGVLSVRRRLARGLDDEGDPRGQLKVGLLVEVVMLT